MRPTGRPRCAGNDRSGTPSACGGGLEHERGRRGGPRRPARDLQPRKRRWLLRGHGTTDATQIRQSLPTEHGKRLTVHGEAISVKFPLSRARPASGLAVRTLARWARLRAQRRRCRPVLRPGSHARVPEDARAAGASFGVAIHRACTARGPEGTHSGP